MFSQSVDYLLIFGGIVFNITALNLDVVLYIYIYIFVVVTLLLVLYGRKQFLSSVSNPKVIKLYLYVLFS